ncbi:MAG: alpha/beta hydrolase [Myxococcota bacterium]
MRAISLLLHSTGTTPSMWDGVPSEVLSGTARIAPTNLGVPPNPPLLRGQPGGAAEDAAHALAAIPDDAEVIDLYGHSYGAVLALDLLPRLGSRVRSIFLYEPVLFGALARSPDVDPAAAEEARAFRDHPWFLRDEERGGTEAWIELFIDYWNRPGSWARMPEAQRAETIAVGWKMYQEVRSCFLDARSFEAIILGAPTVTLAVGERSPAASRAMSAALARRNPGAVLFEVVGTGHMGPLTHPDRVRPALLDHAARRG